ncbi:hypothetical protein L1987_34297 [Smallanthus sonchifolius]|uniref:Uncharacterized protein n=1 Tax=Smallanthus sonchifolius TaxID=185202 RepID=A0ACB9HTF9_9ASTR|nr:hypothetical protein L1987_34297 [Smallanthus sonchifolius]
MPSQINGEFENLKEGPTPPKSNWMISGREKLDLAKKDPVAGTWGKKSLQNMDCQKWRAFDQILKREGFMKLCYSLYEPVFAMRGSTHSIRRDMIMRQNQIPLFILDWLLGLQGGQPDQKSLVAKLALKFSALMPIDEPLTKSDQKKMESSANKVTNKFDVKLKKP